MTDDLRRRQRPPGSRRRRRLAKAAILIEALPWLERFHGQTVVIKYGGNAMTDDALRAAFAAGRGVPAVRRAAPGGGARRRPADHRPAGPARHASTFRAGLRVTTPETMDVVRMVLTGQVQQGHRRPDQPARPVRGRACPARTPTCSPRGRAARVVDGEQVDIGLVGEVETVDPGAVRALLADGRIPVVSSVARGADGEVYNVNADTAAAALAVALGAAKLVVLTDVEGLYADWPRRSTERGDQPAQRRPSWRAHAARPEQRDDPEDGGLPAGGRRAACRRRTCSTAGCRTPCCWRSSPTPASAPWSSRTTP